MQFKLGFTLIELLVVVTIVMLLVGGGIAAYLNFNEKQTLLSSAKELQVFLRSAQKKARSGDKPTDCAASKLVNYTVVLTAGSNTVVQQAVCESGSYNINDLDLDEGVTLQESVNLSFKVLHGGVDNAGSVTLDYQGKSYQFEVTSGGSITSGDFL